MSNAFERDAEYCLGTFDVSNFEQTKKNFAGERNIVKLFFVCTKLKSHSTKVLRKPTGGRGPTLTERWPSNELKRSRHTFSKHSRLSEMVE